MGLGDTVLDAISPFLVRVSRRLDGNLAGRYLPEARAVLRGSADEIERHQLSRLRSIALTASRRCEFYQENVRQNWDPESLSFRSFSQLFPLLTRSDLREHAAGLRNRDYATSQLRQSASGGTTSSPVPFHMDWECLYRRHAATLAFDAWLGYQPGQKLALLWGALQDVPKESSWGTAIRRRLVDRQLFLPSQVLDEKIMEDYYRALIRFRPSLLRAYPSPLTDFAHFLNENGYRLPVKAVSTTAEPLLDYQRDEIRKAFATEPYDFYGTREMGRVATECSVHNGLHINCYGLYVEIVNKERYGGAGIGEVVLTDLWNVGMPLVRYHIGDLAAFDFSPCPCGSRLPRLVKVTGRVTDMFVNSRGQRVAGVAFTNRFIRDCDEVVEMQIVQLAVGRFQLLVVPGERYSSDTADRLSKDLKSFIQEELDVEIKMVDAIPLEKSGKRRFCKNLVHEASEPERLG